MKKIILFFFLSITTGFTCLPAYGQTTILSENFSGTTIPSVPSGWSNVVISSGFAPLGWVTLDTTIQLYNSFIPVMPLHNTYVMVNDWEWPYDTVASLTSPVFSLAGTTHPYLSYDYFYLEGNNGFTTITAEKTWVNISTNGGSSWSTIDTLRATGFKWRSKYLDISAYAGFPSVRFQYVYTDSGQHMYGCALDNIQVFDAVAKDIALLSVSPKEADPASDYFKIGGNASFNGTVFNHGTDYIYSFTANYQVGVLTPVTTTISGVSIAPFTSYSFTATPSYTISSIGKFPVKVWTKVPMDTNLINDSMSTAVYGVSRWPHKNVFFEEGTGTWCGYCVRGIVYMDSLSRLYDTGVNIVSVHCSVDPMDSENSVTENYAAFLEKAIDYAYPSIFVDRQVSADAASTFGEYDVFKKMFALADINFGSVHATGSTMDATVNVTPATNVQGDYRLQLILTEDKVHNSSGSYAQKNYYSYQSDNIPMSDVNYNFQDSLLLIPANSMYYDFVARYIVPDPSVSPNGAAGSLPATMTDGTRYSYTFKNVPLSADWKNVKVTAILINNANGYVYNSAHAILPLSCIDISEHAASLQLFPDPATNEISVRFHLAESGEIRLKIYDVMGRVVMETTEQSLHSGDQKLNISTANLPDGIYNFSVEHQSGNICRRFIIKR